jgi:hypothetical protein
VCDVKLLHTDATLTHDEFFQFSKDAGVFFYVSDMPPFEDVYASEASWMDQMKSVQNGQVYDYMKSGRGAWFEQRMAEYDVVTQDFCTVANMTTNPYAHERKWFRNVLQQEGIGSLPPCENTTAPLVTQATPCLEIGEGLDRPDVSGDDLGDKEDGLLFGDGEVASENVQASSDPNTATTISLNVYVECAMGLLSVLML